MPDNDDLENFNNPDKDAGQEQSPDEENVFDADAQSASSMDDIFANIPPIPEDYDASTETSSSFVAGQDETVTVQPVKFASFDETKSLSGDAAKNLDNLLDIKLQLTVELGRTTLPVKKVLELTRGSIVELEKIAGEPVELYANGKLIAHGEVVVIEDNFGLRITSMSEPENRLNSLQ